MMNNTKRNEYYPIPGKGTSGCNGMFIAGRCYRCETASSTVVNTKHPIYKRMCTSCRDWYKELVQKKLADSKLKGVDKT